MVFSSLKTSTEVMQIPPTLLPNQLLWENFIEIWNSGPFLDYFINSVIVTFGTMFFQLITVVPAAYAFAVYEFKGKGFFWGIILASLMIPPQLIFTSLFLRFSEFNMLNTYWSLILPFASSGFGIFMLRQTFMKISTEVIEAARLDRANEFKIITKIMFPLARPTIVTLMLFTFISQWNDYFWPLVMTTTEEVRTLPVGITMFSMSEAIPEWNLIMAANVILVLPILIIYLFAQRKVIDAFTYSGVK